MTPVSDLLWSFLPVDKLESVLVEVIDELLEVGVVGLRSQTLSSNPLYFIPVHKRFSQLFADSFSMPVSRETFYCH
jgi:hypothetical protein